MIRSYVDCVKRYGAIVNGVWGEETQWCFLWNVPTAIAAQVVNSATGQPWTHVYVNRDMQPALAQALQNVLARNLLDQLHTFDGCFMIRDVRAQPGHPSCHSYALAIDLNASENPLGQVPSMSPELVKCFTDAGFTWGGTFRRQDGMHFSLAWE